MTALGRAEAYCRAALDRLFSELAEAGAGERNTALNRVAYRAGRLASAGALDSETIARDLEAVALALGLARHEVVATVRSGLCAGMSNPAWIPGGKAGGRCCRSTRTPQQHPAPPESGQAPRPPRAEVECLWRLARPVTADPEVSAWLTGRAILPERVELQDLARAIPPRAKLPRWARCRGVPWSAHHRLVARGCGATGAAESLHVRAATEPPRGLPKGLWPAAGPGSARGLVMADGWGRALLASGRRPAGWSGVLLICEGLSDWLTAATAFSDADPDAPAVMGVTSGSWTAEVAVRVPDGTRVVLATDPDKAGDKYAMHIARTLAGRCEWRRWKGPGG